VLASKSWFCNRIEYLSMISVPFFVTLGSYTIKGHCYIVKGDILRKCHYNYSKAVSFAHSSCNTHRFLSKRWLLTHLTYGFQFYDFKNFDLWWDNHYVRVLYPFAFGSAGCRCGRIGHDFYRLRVIDI